MRHSSHAGSGGGVTQALSVKTSSLLYQLQTKIVMKLSGQVLKVKTGALRSSVNVEGSTEAGGIISGGVGIPARPTRPYALAHELGHSAPYQITAVRARALAFQMSTKATARTIFAQHVVQPPIPPRPFVHPVLEENRSEIIQQCADEIARVL
jgi:hypothetical protein